jgi:alkanesulfonate monooxygenase SsuD/methylene tetrahydromethanopterin reductase-like flavin-dependent oxidoreductase (luciferase family)
VRKRIGFLSFGHWQDAPGSQTRTAADALNQTIELAQAAEQIGIDGAYVRVHHFAPQLASPFPLLAAIGACTERIEIGTAVIDMRYENPLYMAEEAAAADLIAGGRLQLGLSRGSPEPALNGAHAFGYVPPEGETDADAARAKTAYFREAITGRGVVESDPTMTGGSFNLPIQPQSPGLADRIWWGSGTRETARWAAAQGVNLQSSTLLSEDTGVPFGELQAEQIDVFRDAWIATGLGARATRLGQPQRAADPHRRGPPVLRRPARRRQRPARQARRHDRALRAQLHRGAGRDRERARQGPGRADGRHGAAHRPKPARGRVLRGDARDDCAPHSAGVRLVACGKGRARCRFIQ